MSFEAECRAPGIAFRWRGEIVGEATGVLTFKFIGDALVGFWKNRIGLCVLHPIDGFAGEKCRIETVDGNIYEEMFPMFIAPDQPFKRVRAITCEASPGLSVEVRFEGEIFETEDQRNWTDASFKTYSTPLEQPFPVWIERGMRVEQTVRVCLVGRTRHPPIASLQSAGMELRASGTARVLPPIGFSMASHGIALNAKEAALLRRLQPAHLRVDLHLGERDWQKRWQEAGKAAAVLGSALHVALFVSEDAERELNALAAEYSSRPFPVSLWIIFSRYAQSTEARWLRVAQATLPHVATVAAGTNANFAELNRARPDKDETALPCFSINPQVHASDDASLMENLGAQAATVESAQWFAPRLVVISPITLRPRFNAIAVSQEDSKVAGLPPQVDPRQRTLLGAAWTVGSLARLATLSGVHSLTYYETTGWRGVMESEGGSPAPVLFPSKPGEIFPLFHIFAAVVGYEDIQPVHSTHPLQLDGFCLIARDGRCRWIIANLTPFAQSMSVHTGAATVTLSLLEEISANGFSDRGPSSTVNGLLEIRLEPYGIAQIDA